MKPTVRYKKAVILGASGFLGVNLARHLAVKGFDIVCFDRVTSPHLPETSRSVIGDFENPPDELVEELNDAVVFHLVSSCLPSTSTEKIFEEIDRDVKPTLQYLELTKGRNIRWVFFSSGGTVYGQNEADLITETSDVAPICSYGIVKLTIERYFDLYRRLYKSDFITVRLANPYGSFQNPSKGQGIIAAMLQRALRGEELEVWGDGSNVRDYIYISDAVYGVVAAAMMGQSGEIYNIGSGQGTSINQLIEIIARTLHMDIGIKYTTPRSVDVKKNVLNSQKLFYQSGWKPKVNINIGVEKTADWLKSLS